MTDRAELIALQKGARSQGRVANLIIDSEGWISSIFYRDPKGGPRARTGFLCPPISFAEIEREKQHNS
jgi:hypothetical protein